MIPQLQKKTRADQDIEVLFSKSQSGINKGQPISKISSLGF
jgi:hypothetical protein